MRNKRQMYWGFPGGAVVENPPANAGDTGSSPGPGRSHMPWSGWAHEPQLLSLHIWSLCSAAREATRVRASTYGFGGDIHLSIRSSSKTHVIGASLVAQWLRICLPMQGTRVRALVWEDPTCCGATGPVSHNY